MIETEILWGEPVGAHQEVFGAEIIESCAETALVHFFETMNASMAPLLNAPGLAMLYAPDAVLETELPALAGSERVICTGRAEIEDMFEQLSRRMVSVSHCETDRRVIGRKAFWFGSINGIRRSSCRKVVFNASIRLDFDDEDRVERQWCRITPRSWDSGLLAAAASPAAARKGRTSG